MSIGPIQRRAALCLLMGLLGEGLAQAGEIVLAAASSMREPIEEIVARFEGETGHTVRLSLGSSGNFFGQISNGAPFDVYLAADSDYPQRLVESGLAAPASLRVYATGRIVLWTRNDSALDLETLGMDALLDPAVRRVAIANPRLAPYGRAAVAAMEHYGIYEQIAPRIVTGDSVAQAAQFVASGAAEVGIIALSLASSTAMRDRGRYWKVPEIAHPPIRHAMVALDQAARAGHAEAAGAFEEFLRTDFSRRVLERFGFSVP